MKNLNSVNDSSEKKELNSSREKACSIILIFLFFLLKGGILNFVDVFIFIFVFAYFLLVFPFSEENEKGEKKWK